MNIDSKFWLEAALGAFTLILLAVVLVKRLRGLLRQLGTKRKAAPTDPAHTSTDALQASPADAPALRPTPTAHSAEAVTPQGSDELFGTLTPALAAQIPIPQGTLEELQKELRQAGYYRPTALREFSALRFVLVIGTILFVGLLALALPESRMRQVVVGGVIAATLAFSLPRLVLAGQGWRRKQLILAGLPDAIELINMGVTRGLTFSTALDRVQTQLRDVHPELSRELEIVQQQAKLGSLEQALRQFEQRVDAPEIRTLTGILSQTERLGTSLSAALETSAGSIRTALKNHAERTSNSAPFKLLFPIVLCLLPAVYMVILAPAAVELTKFMRTNSNRVSEQTNRARLSRGINNPR